MDFYRTMAPFVVAALSGLGAALAMRNWVHFQRPLAGVVACTIIMGIVYLAVLALIPKGRLALWDAGKSLLVALKRK
jgi:hypothetical protein